MTRNTQDSEDVLQEGLLLAFRNLHQFQGRSKFSTWLHCIITNSAKMHARKRRSRPICSIEGERSGENSLALDRACVDRSPDPEEICTRKERSQILTATLEELPPVYKSVIRLCDIEGRTGRDVAEALGMTISALKTCLHRARRLLSQKIRKSCTHAGSLPSRQA
jgi:RNA polymerase sigma-70 factor (ECF subfamily)